MGDRLNRIAQLKPAMYLRGIEQIMLDMAGSPEVAEAIFGRIRRFYAEYLRRILEAARGGVDIVLTGDDFGSQNGPLLSPAMWTRFLAGGFREYVGIIRAHDARSMHHTCGAVAPLVPLMADAGLNVLQSLQPEAMAADLPDLKRRFGARLAFQGGISIQRTMPHGTVAEIRREVESRVALLAPGGGYILCTAHNVQADCPVSSVEALMQAYHDLGRYS
jgi:uroporphyrinogen decarboxylase